MLDKLRTLAQLTTIHLEQRQPLEVRVTDINLGVLAREEIRPVSEVNQEYLLP